LLGYFGLFDLGLGRATAYRIAALKKADGASRADTYWAAIFVNIGFGVVGAAILWLASEFFFNRIFKVSAEIRPEILVAIPWLAASVPIATMSGVLTGALQGRERFLEVNVISVLSTTLFQLFPLLVAWRVSPYLPNLLAAAVAARILALVVLAYRCHVELARSYAFKLSMSEVRALLGYGSWVSLTAIFGPMLVIVDRFAIGAILGAAKVTIYSIPFQLAQRVAVFPTALTTAMFPRIASASPEEQQALGDRASEALLCLLSLPVFAINCSLELLLRAWIGKKIGPEAAEIGRVLLIGFWINAFALIPYARLQASGRPDLVTKVLLVQIPPYLVGLYFGMTRLGLVGSSLAFSTRCAVDFMLLTLVSRSSLKRLPVLVLNGVALSVSAASAIEFTMNDWRWWVSGLVCGLVLTASTVAVVPPELKTLIQKYAFGKAERGINV
jgi:O-antigen/teichoic acid export membrane protein